MTYCTHEDVTNLFGDISADVSSDMLDRVIQNSTVWIDHKLKQNNIPIPSPGTVEILNTIASYYSACQIVTSLYHGDEKPEVANVWCGEAKTLMDEYIEGYLDNPDNPEYTNMVRHSHGRTYNQKRGRRGVRRWVR